MDCEICLELLDLQAHCPKVLACGHTVCLQCLQRLPQRQCPTCKKKFTGKPADLPTNFRLMDRMERSVKQKAKPVAFRGWCLDCCKLASEDCVDHHRLSDPRAALQQNLQLLDAEDRKTLTASLSDRQAVSALKLLYGDPSSSCTVTLSGVGQFEFDCNVLAGRDEGTAAADRQTSVKKGIVSAFVVIMAEETDLIATEEGSSFKDKRAEAGIESLDLASLTFPLLTEKKEEKAALLGRVRRHGVKKLTGVHCQRDPDWCLQLLESAAPYLEELEVEKVNRDHVTALLFMPRLRQMDCEICLELLDLQAHRPTVLSCGHTVCLQCLQRLPQRQCPTCKKKFTGKPDDLPNNFRLLDMMERSAKEKVKPVAGRWCLDCSKVPTEDCVDEQHRLSDPRAALQQHLQLLDAEGRKRLAASLSDDQVMSALQLLSCDPSAARTVTLSGEGQFALEWNVQAGRGEGATAREDSVTNRLLSALTVVMVRETGEEELVVTGSLKEKRAEGSIASLDVASLTYPVLKEKKEEKAALLDRARQRGVKKLTGVHCQRDPDWCLQLVETAAPFLEELEVEWVSAAHIMALLFMPRLRRLVLIGGSRLLMDSAIRLPQLCAHNLKCLQRLELRYLPLDTVIDLLQILEGSLQVLVLSVGCSDASSSKWPQCYPRLGEMLERAGLRALRKVLLRRSFMYYHRDCEKQMTDIRTRLPGVVALCSVCDKDKTGDF